MSQYNHMKEIRNIYGATQDDIAKVAGVNRSTVSQWESGALRASSVKLEKLSLFYGIGPESFYDLPEIDDTRRNLLIQTAKKEKEVQTLSEQKRSKADELTQLLENITFREARSRFMFSMKLLLATADNSELEDLKTAYLITEKMANRLKAFVDLREEEERAKRENNEQTLYELLDALSDEK